MDEKARKVEELESEIQNIIESQMRENSDLKLKVSGLQGVISTYHQVEDSLRSNFGRELTFGEMVDRLLT